MSQNPSAAFAQPVSMPAEFPEILKDFTREILRHQPDEIYDFGVKYFDQKCHTGKDTNFGFGDDISLEEIEKEVQALFERYDEDKSGYLETNEFRLLLKDLRTRLPFITEDDLQFFLCEADVNQDNKIEYHEFIPIALQIIQTVYSRKKCDQENEGVRDMARSLVRGMDKEELERVLHTIFQAFDTDGSGSLSRDEFVKALQSMELGLTRREVNCVLSQYDTNRDGQISYNEFVPFAFDLLARLGEMRIVETQMSEDGLAQLLADRFRANADKEEQGFIDTDEAKKVLHEASLGLTRLQIYSILSVAGEGARCDNGLLNCALFIPKAVAVIRSMCNFESSIENEVAARETVAAVQNTLESLPDGCSLGDFTEALTALDLEKMTKDALFKYVQEMGEPIKPKSLVYDAITIVRNMQGAAAV